jgi:transcriptional regulator with GAF, ATPase, and Fis domain
MLNTFHDFFRDTRYGSPGESKYLAELLRRLAEVTQAEGASYWTMNAQGILTIKHSTDLPKEKWKELSAKAALREGCGGVGRALFSRRTLSYPGELLAGDLDGTIDKLQGHSTRAMLAAPVCLEGGPSHGVIYLGRFRNSDRFTYKQKSALDIVARLFANAMEHHGVLPVSVSANSEVRIPIGNSPAFADVLDSVQNAAQWEGPLLLLGETGTGKEVLAQFAHAVSKRRSGPFVPVNCAIPNLELLHSTLFGHVKGAYTGASSDRKGAFETAASGTLFLDEIGNAPLSLQQLLLRALQEKTGARLGSDEERTYTARIITATNADVASAIQSGEFREDLFHRINECMVKIPPLRERREDIPLLAEHFLKEFAGESKGPLSATTQNGMEYLQERYWPGNIRQLRAVLRAAAIESKNSAKIKDDLLKHHYDLRDITSGTRQEAFGKLVLSRKDAADKEAGLRKKVQEAAKLPENWNKKGKPVVAKIARYLKIDERTVGKYFSPE